MSNHNSTSGIDGPNYVGNLCQRVRDALDVGQLPVEVFNDEKLFKRETSALFTKAWIFVGHESEIANKNDFIGRNPV